MPDQASSSRACSSPSKAPSIPPTGMRSPTKIRTPTKLVRPRETLWASKAKDVKKRLLDAAEDASSSALPPPKRLKLSHAQPPTQLETQDSISEAPDAGDAVEAEEEEGYADGLHRRVQVAHALEEDLLRDNARMRLKALALRDEVGFYYGVLARIELIALQHTGQDKGQVKKLVEQLQGIISASKPVEGALAVRKED